MKTNYLSAPVTSLNPSLVTMAAWDSRSPAISLMETKRTSFADGHAEFHRWKAPKDSPRGNISEIQNGGDREDHTWLLDGLPRIQ